MLTFVQLTQSLKRQISELSFQRMMMPVGIGLMLLILFVKILTKGKESTTSQTVKSEVPSFSALLDSFNITISSYGFLVNLYPIYSKMSPKIRTFQNGLSTAAISLFITMLVNLTFS